MPKAIPFGDVMSTCVLFIYKLACCVSKRHTIMMYRHFFLFNLNIKECYLLYFDILQCPVLSLCTLAPYSLTGISAVFGFCKIYFCEWIIDEWLDKWTYIFFMSIHVCFPPETFVLVESSPVPMFPC